MAITIKELLRLNSMSSFTLVAGGGGLTQTVEIIDMLDFAWERYDEFSSIYYEKDKIFDEHSFVISSLMFANNAPQKIYGTIQRLIKYGVVGLAFKTAFYSELPAEVYELANRSNFAIFRIDNDVTYREIIVEVTEAIRQNKNILESADCLSQMLRQVISVDEVAALAAKLSPDLRGHAKIALIVPMSEENAFSVDYTIRNFRMYEEFKRKVLMFGYLSDTNPGVALIATMDEKNVKKMDVILNIAIETCGINPETVFISYSNIHRTFTDLNQCVVEASEALTACKVLQKQSVQYNELGTLSFLIPSINNPYVRTYMQSFLKPILPNEEDMKTVIAFVRAGGNHSQSAEELHLHVNTLRYRIKRIHSLLAPELSDESFYECLAVAVKIYLICRPYDVESKQLSAL